MSRLNDEVFLILCVNRSSTQFDSHCVQLFHKEELETNQWQILHQNANEKLKDSWLFWKGNLKLRLLSWKTLTRHFTIFLISFGHTEVYLYEPERGRKKEEEEIGFETRLSMVKHAFWAAVKRVRKTCINFQNSRMEEPTTKGHSNTRPQRSLRSLNGEKKQHHHNFQNLCQWARNMRTHFFKVCQSH